MLNGAFWTDFIAEVWNKKPYLFHQLLASPIANSEEIFGLMKSASYQYETGLRPSMNVYVNRGMLYSDLNPYLVSHRHETLSEYTTMIESLPGVEEFTFVLYGCQLFSPELWARVRSFVDALCQEIGLPAGHVDLDIFVGRYKRTPTGIHKDAAANFSFIIHGEKAMAFWPNSTFKGNGPGSARYEAFEQGRTILDGNEGDVLFWPPDYWHMAFSPNTAWSITLNVALYIARHPLSFINQAFAVDRRGAHELQAFDATQTYPLTDQVPEQVKTELQLYRDIVNNSSLEDAVSELWARRKSAGGFQSVPAKAARESVRETDTIVRSARAPIVAVKLANGDGIVAANGHALRVPNYERVKTMIDYLNDRESCLVEQLRETVGLPNGSGNWLVEILSSLHSFGAFSLEHSSALAPDNVAVTSAP